jgi:hypothetical protein
METLFRTILQTFFTAVGFVVVTVLIVNVVYQGVKCIIQFIKKQTKN